MQLPRGSSRPLVVSEAQGLDPWASEIVLASDHEVEVMKLVQPDGMSDPVHDHDHDCVPYPGPGNDPNLCSYSYPSPWSYQDPCLYPVPGPYLSSDCDCAHGPNPDISRVPLVAVVHTARPVLVPSVRRVSAVPHECAHALHVSVPPALSVLLGPLRLSGVGARASFSLLLL